METDINKYVETLCAIETQRKVFAKKLYDLGFSPSVLSCMGLTEMEQACKMDCEVFGYSVKPINAGKCSVAHSTFDEGLFIKNKFTDSLFGYRKVFGEYYIEFKAMDILESILSKDSQVINEDEKKFVLELATKTSCWMDSFQHLYWLCPAKIAKAGRSLMNIFYYPSGRLRKNITKIALLRYVQQLLEFKSRLNLYNVKYIL